MYATESLSRDELIELVLKLESRLEELEAENAKLRALVEKTPPLAPPSFVKPNRRKEPGPSKERKPRDGSFVRRRDEPTEIREHAVGTCPDCGRGLSDGWLHRRRQVIELPEAPIRIIEHRVMGRWCGVCGKRRLPQVDLSSEVVGKSRIGHGLMSLIGYLHTFSRMPLNQIQGFLEALYGLHLGMGTLAGVLRRLASHGEERADAILAEIRASGVVHADETGWREDGKNGHLWSFSTPERRYCRIAESRGSAVAKEILGEDFAGVVVSDFYSGYSPLLCRHQRCWVHLLRDLRDLREAHPEEKGIARWVKRIRALYDQAIAYRDAQLALDLDEAGEDAKLFSRVARRRAKAREKFESALMRLASPYLGQKDDPCRVLAERMSKFLSELFVFVERPEVPSENNAAERAIRPAVIARKVSGGTRSAAGSKTKSILLTLFGTWALSAPNPFAACHAMLASSQPP